MRTVTKKYYNEMGDGYDEVVILQDCEDESVTIIHVGRYADVDTPSVVDTTGMNKKGYRA